ncbi:pyroglutamyl-peptidase I [Jeotgalibacillus salarius]|uniref:Pyroglutamyl-peptidase I n=1 Tax=Jeotgalibacillus salarius TaxID=546023 RepID=A0A4Y8LGS5_9BACL|nr:pyroglutamyl-peptidase I [Jeotgalibacillus salarius]TFE02010.1 pyroglutamyl-peptidase I [Jeotgalibacillus salarius]
MKTLLLTGFEPFLQFKKNPTMEIIKELDGQTINGWKIAGRTLKVDFNQSGDQVIHFYEEVKPDAVISLGLAGGRTHITPERIAINCNDGEQDNSGYVPSGEKIIADGQDGMFSTLPISNMVAHLNEKGFPASISNSAGTYLCNHVMYRMLNHIQNEGREIPSGFIHIPASHDIAIESRRLPSWSQNDLTAGIRLCIEQL